MQHTKDNRNKQKMFHWLYSARQISPVFDAKRYLIPTVIAYGCGICLILSRYRAAKYAFLLYLTSLVAVYFILSVVISVLFKKHCTNLSPFLRIKWMLLSLLLLSVFILGMYRAHYAIEFSHKTLKNEAGNTVWVCGTVETTPKLTSSGYYIGFTLEPYHIENKNGDSLQPLTGKIQVYLPEKYKTLQRTDAIEGYLELEKPTGANFLGGFDYAMYLNQNDIPLIAFGKSVTMVDAPERSLFQKYQDIGLAINHSISESVSRHFSYDKDCAAILTGILIGDKSSFSDELYEDFSKSGLIHVAAVSGLHVSFLIAALSFLLTRFRIPKSIIHLLLIPVLLLFLSAAAFTPSVCRAVIMTILFLLSYTIQKEPDQKTALFAAAVIMLTVNPYLLFNAGFILSFGSVIGIQLFSPLLDRKFRSYLLLPKKRMKPSVWRHGITKAAESLSSALGVSISSFLGTFYFIAYFFQLFSLAGIIAGLWVVPCISLLFVGGYVIWLFDFVTPWIGNILRCFLALPLEIVKKTAQLLSDSSLVQTVPSPPASMFFFYLTFLFLLYFYLKYSRNFDRENIEQTNISA